VFILEQDSRRVGGKAGSRKRRRGEKAYRGSRSEETAG